MAEYIEREYLLEDIDASMNDSGMGYIIGQILKRYVKRQTPADVAPVRHGRWVYHAETIHTLAHTRCSVCRSIRYEHYVNDFRYCPSCGAKMDGGGDG